MSNDRQYRPIIKVSIPSNRLRKMTAWILFVVLILLLQFYFTTFRDSQIVKYTFGVSESRAHKKQNLKRGPLHILLVAYPRTGSSFVGDLIQSLPNSFYHFEPLHFIQGSFLNGSFYEARDLLDNLFQCNISQIEGFLLWQKSHKAFMKLERNIRYWKNCFINKTCYNGTYIDSFCRNQTLVLIKTIRMNLYEASKLFTSHPHLNLKLIYLVRDPRGTMNSRKKHPVKMWCRHDPMCINPNQFCSRISDDVTTMCSLSINRPEDFLVIRYEDISINPYSVASQLVKFIGLSEVPDQTLDFLKTHTHFTGNKSNRSKALGLSYAYTTFRNSSATAMIWTKEMTFKYVFFLQKVCKRFLSSFGYHSYRTVSSLRANTDINIDLKTALACSCNNTVVKSWHHNTKIGHWAFSISCLLLWRRFYCRSRNDEPLKMICPLASSSWFANQRWTLLSLSNPLIALTMAFGCL